MKFGTERTGKEANGKEYHFILDDCDMAVDVSKQRQSIVNKAYESLVLFLKQSNPRRYASISPQLNNPNASNSTDILTKSSAQPRLSVQRSNTGTSLVGGHKPDLIILDDL